MVVAARSRPAIVAESLFLALSLRDRDFDRLTAGPAARAPIDAAPTPLALGLNELRERFVQRTHSLLAGEDVQLIGTR